MTIVHRLLDDLPSGEKEAVRLTQLDGHTLQSAAVQLDVSLSEVDRQVRSGLRRMRDLVQDDETLAAQGKWSLIRTRYHDEIQGFCTRYLQTVRDSLYVRETVNAVFAQLPRRIKTGDAIRTKLYQLAERLCHHAT